MATDTGGIPGASPAAPSQNPPQGPRDANPSGEPDRRKPPTIIDLQASEVARGSDPARPAEQPDPAIAASSGSGPSGTPNPGSAAGQAETEAQSSASFEASPVEIEGATIAGDPQPGSAGGAPAAALAARRTTPFGALLAAAILGGAAAALGLIAFDRAGLHPFTATIADADRPADPAPRLAALESALTELRAATAAAPGAAPADLAPLRAELDAVKAEVAALENAPSPQASVPAAASVAGTTDVPTADTARLAALESRLDGLTSDLAGLRTDATAAADARSAAESRLADVSARLDAAARDVAALAARPVVDLAPVETAIAGLQSDLGALSERLDQMPSAERVAAVEDAAAEATRRSELSAALGPAVAANALGAALDAGSGFAPELSALRSLGVDEARLASLTPYAAQGLPTTPELRRLFDDAIAPLDLAAPIPAETGPLGRLLGSARNLVTVRPANPVAGADPASVVSRIRGDLDRADLSAALSERDTLPDVVKDATADWAKLAAARRDAIALAVGLRGDALAKVIGEGPGGSPGAADPASAPVSAPTPDAAPDAAPATAAEPTP